MTTHASPHLLAVAIGVFALLASACAGGGSTNTVTMTSGKQEFYNAGCDGLVFDSRVDKGRIAILAIFTGEAHDQELGNLLFDLESGQLTTNNATSLIVDKGEPAKSFLKSDEEVCFQFAEDDEPKHSCFESLIGNGAFCMKLEPEAAIE